MNVKEWEVACLKCGSATPKQRPTCISCDAPLGDLFEPQTRGKQKKARKELIAKHAGRLDEEPKTLPR